MDHMQSKLYRVDPKVQASQEEEQGLYDELVFRLLSTPDGVKFKETLDEYLKQPVWFAGEDNNMSLYREGARHYIMQLLDAYKRIENK